MAIAAYDSDLTSANSGEIAVGNTATDSGTWDESSNASWDDAGPPGDETNFYINLTNCISAQFTKTGQGTIMYDDGGTTHSVDTNGAVLIWYFWASPASLSTYANGGIKILAGSSLGDFYAWDCGGSNFEPNPLGGWYCYALDPAIASPDDTVGTPGSAPYDVFGIATNATAQARGFPSAVNAIRVGRCTLEVTNGQAGSYGTFAGMESFDTSTNQRYGLFQNIFGAYRWQGLMSLGTSGTSVDFRDGNVSINVANTPNVTSSFNKIEINNSSSNVEWSNVIMTSPGVNDTVASTASRGDFEVVDNATVDIDGCSFTDMGAFTFNDGTNSNTITGTTFRRCNLITTGGATLTSCIIDDTNDATKAVVVDAKADAEAITETEFISGGTGHGLQIGDGSTVLTTQTINITGHDYTGYDVANPGTAANKAIWVNSGSGGGTVTLNISGGSGVTQTYHVRATNCTVAISANISVTFSNMKDNSEVRVYENINETNTDISFTASDTISSAGSGFGDFAADDIVRITGSDDNDGTYTVVTASASTLTVLPATIVTESAGASIKIKKTNQTELQGIEDATAGSPDARTFIASVAAGTLVDYVIHNFQSGETIYQTIRVIDFTWPSSAQTIVINQQLDRNAE